MASRVEWALWANELALMSGVMLMIGGLVAVVEECELWGLSAVGLALGSLVSLIEYPRGAKVDKEKVDEEGARRPREDTRAQRREEEAAPRRAPAGEPKRRPRRAQELLERLVDALGMVTTSYYSRALLYTTMSIPCGFTLSTFLGSISLFLASLLYLRAAVAGESWVSGRARPRHERRVVAACFIHIQRQLSSVTWRLGASGTDDDTAAAAAATPVGASERTPLLAP
ncbi:cytochrome b-245 light chain-like [Lethenteron reissneri]|uniref:cytochrome b-245 light chain-like n=1 Tax=Lethenteron reissneri TaxID=7753 RepID=UPI002AB69B5E|nr:cytochrome b-245 light chain-like [Lethenteron reissneri]